MLFVTARRQHALNFPPYLLCLSGEPCNIFCALLSTWRLRRSCFLNRKLSSIADHEKSITLHHFRNVRERKGSGRKQRSVIVFTTFGIRDRLLCTHSEAKSCRHHFIFHRQWVSFEWYLEPVFIQTIDCFLVWWLGMFWCLVSITSRDVSGKRGGGGGGGGRWDGPFKECGIATPQQIRQNKKKRNNLRYHQLLSESKRLQRNECSSTSATSITFECL